MTDRRDAANLQLETKPDLDEVLRRWEAFWAGEMIDRPVVTAALLRQGAERPPRPRYQCFLEDVRTGAEAAVAWVEAHEFLGDLVPHVSPDQGPDQYAAWLGAQIHSSPDSTETNWVEPVVTDWRQAMPLTIDGENPYWRRTLEAMAALREAGAGRFVVGSLDMHSNYDALSALRGAQGLCMDLYDDPKAVAEAAGQVGDTYPGVIDALARAGGLDQGGYVGWIPCYSRRRFAVTQCDFACMLSKEMFDELALPELKREWAVLDRTAYHFDGVTALQHMPTILAQEEVDIVQWVPGAGQKQGWEWVELQQRIQQAGKAVNIGGSVEDLKTIHPHLDPSRTFYQVWGSTRDEILAFLDWLKDNS